MIRCSREERLRRNCQETPIRKNVSWMFGRFLLRDLRQAGSGLARERDPGRCTEFRTGAPPDFGSPDLLGTTHVSGLVMSIGDDIHPRCTPPRHRHIHHRPGQQEDGNGEQVAPHDKMIARRLRALPRRRQQRQHVGLGDHAVAVDVRQVCVRLDRCGRVRRSRTTPRLGRRREDRGFVSLSRSHPEFAERRKPASGWLWRSQPQAGDATVGVSTHRGRFRVGPTAQYHLFPQRTTYSLRGPPVPSAAHVFHRWGWQHQKHGYLWPAYRARAIPLQRSREDRSLDLLRDRLEAQPLLDEDLVDPQ